MKLSQNMNFTLSWDFRDFQQFLIQRFEKQLCETEINFEKWWQNFWVSDFEFFPSAFAKHQNHSMDYCNRTVLFYFTIFLEIDKRFIQKYIWIVWC